ncbi:MAG: penicillin acylase family protein, partial [Gammaproteobacteria bacterium]
MMRGILITVVLAFLVLPPALAEDLSTEANRAVIYRDVDGIVHIVGPTEADVLYAQGYAHARDRFFQMDTQRRQASGTLGELLGEGVIDDDVLLRTLGLRRAAQRSLGAVSQASLAGLDAYAEGVNDWLARNPLPSEYDVLEITSVAPWTPLDSLTLAKLLAFGLSFDLDVDLTTALVSYQSAGAAQGFDGTALFFEDLQRAAPFDPASTVPDAGGSNASRSSASLNERTHWRHFDTSYLNPKTLRDAQAFVDRLKRVPVIGDALVKREGITGSNEWAVAGKHTKSGRPIMANDPHLALGQPSTFYQNHLVVSDGSLDVIGSSFTGVPLVVLGQNRHISWGATTNPFDVTDTFQEQLAPDPTSQFGLGTVTNGEVEPLDFAILSFSVNRIGDGVNDNLETIGGLTIPPFVLTVPKRNNGPIVSLDVPNLAAVSIQYTGFGPTREVDAFRAWNYARNLSDFTDGLQYFDFGSQNWAYTDIDGNIAYFSSGEMPLREDLQAQEINGLPPFFIRDGTGGNEWLLTDEPGADQANPYQLLPFAEMPQVVNPANGYFVNANNDPAGNTLDNNALNQLRPGGGIYYLNPGYAIGTRAGRITQALTARLEDGPVTVADMARIQANVQLLDAEYFTPLILASFEQASQGDAPPTLAALASDARVAQAVTRLQSWDFSTPTGVASGYDASDEGGVLIAPSADEIEASINATVYSVWRGQFARAVIDRTLEPLGVAPPGSAQTMSALRNLIERFDVAQGVGASGIDFFAVDGVDDAQARLAIVTLAALRDGLDLLGGEGFAAAFEGSNDQQNYRWGRLHRIVFDHPLGAPYDQPGVDGPLLPSFDDLPGFAVDGGFGAVDASSHSVRAADAQSFMFGSGPVRRYVGQPGSQPGSIAAQTILPGGSSGVLGSPWYGNLMARYLTNTSYPVRQSKIAVVPAIV